MGGPHQPPGQADPTATPLGPHRGRTLVTLATYNERENLPELARAVLGTDPSLELLVIDDNSPDGTGALADSLAAADHRVHVIHRPAKLGLGSATIAAMRFAIRSGYDYVLNMDADFSHHPRYIPALLGGMADQDVMIGSRYAPGGGVPDWPPLRRLMSRAINAYARSMLGLRARDTSGAFRCYRVSRLRRVDLSSVISAGYSFQEEILYRCQAAGCRIGETPIQFEDRRHGRSKIDLSEAVSALIIILLLALRRLGGREASGVSGNDDNRGRP